VQATDGLGKASPGAYNGHLTIDPHHKHIPPDIKNHRLPAPELSFTRPNLPFLIREIEQMLNRTPG
jgi:hypothetical protein